MNKTDQNTLNHICLLYPIPIPLFELASEEGINVIYDEYGKDTFDGMIWYEPGQEKFFIHINTQRGNSTTNSKGRFTLAHELGHYFIEHHREALLNGRMQPHIHRYNPFGKNEEWQIEREADEFAAQLLMPTAKFYDDVKHAVLSGDLIQRLAVKYQVSFSACALRYMKMNLVPIMLVYAEAGKIKWQMKSEDFPFRRLRYGTDKVPENSVMGDYFYRGDSSYCKQSELVNASDCFYTFTENDNRLQFYEYCIPFGKYALSMFWQK